MDKYVIDDFYLNLPKIELHAHITGCVRKSTLLDLASKYNVQNDFSCLSDGSNIDTCFKIFDLINQSLQSLEDLQRVTKEVIQDFQNDNVKYLELRTTPKQNLAQKFQFSDHI